MFGDDPAERRKISTECAKPPAGRDLLRGPIEVHGLGRLSRLFFEGGPRGPDKGDQKNEK